MLTHYGTLRAQLVADLEAVLGPGSYITFGRLTKPKANARYATVLSSVDRSGKGRHVDETWSFSIVILAPLSSVTQGSDPEGMLMELAGDLTMRLAPYVVSDDPNAVPSPAGDYAGVGAQRKVGKVQSTDLRETFDDVSTHVAIVVEFSCTTKVLQ